MTIYPSLSRIGYHCQIIGISSEPVLIKERKWVRLITPIIVIIIYKKLVAIAKTSYITIACLPTFKYASMVNGISCHFREQKSETSNSWFEYEHAYVIELKDSPLHLGTGHRYPVNFETEISSTARFPVDILPPEARLLRLAAPVGFDRQ